MRNPDFFWLRWPKRPTRHTIGKKNQNLSNRPIKAVNGTRKSENRPKRPKIGQQVRIQSGRKCWPPSILLKLLTFLGYPTLHWCSHKPIPLIFCCSWRNDFPRYCYLKLQWLKEGTEKMHSPWRWLFSFFNLVRSLESGCSDLLNCPQCAWSFFLHLKQFQCTSEHIQLHLFVLYTSW